jgi:hypothetical protein
MAGSRTSPALASADRRAFPLEQKQLRVTQGESHAPLVLPQRLETEGGVEVDLALKVVYAHPDVVDRLDHRRENTPGQRLTPSSGVREQALGALVQVGEPLHHLRGDASLRGEEALRDGRGAWDAYAAPWMWPRKRAVFGLPNSPIPVVMRVPRNARWPFGWPTLAGMGCCSLWCRHASHFPQSATLRRGSLQPLCGGPGRDRTCDLGIKVLAEPLRRPAGNGNVLQQAQVATAASCNELRLREASPYSRPDSHLLSL